MFVIFLIFQYVIKLASFLLYFSENQACLLGAGNSQAKRWIRSKSIFLEGLNMFKKGFFLWRQTQLDESCLECGQVGFGLLAETQLEHPRLPEFIELPTFFLPLHPVDLA